MLCPKCNNKVTNNSKVCNFCNHSLNNGVNNFIEASISNEREARELTNTHLYPICSNLLIIISIISPCVSGLIASDTTRIIEYTLISLVIGLLGGYLLSKKSPSKKSISKKKNALFVIGIILFILGVLGLIFQSYKKSSLINTTSFRIIISGTIAFLIGAEVYLFSE